LAVEGRWSANRHPGDGHPGAVRLLAQLRARERARGKVRPEEREGVRVHGEARVPVVGEHPLPGRQVAERGRRGGRGKRERELPRLASRARDGAGAEREPELPEELPPRAAEAVAGAPLHQRFERAAEEARAAGEVADAAEGAFSSRLATSASASSSPSEET